MTACAACGRPVQLAEVATSGTTGLPVLRWCHPRTHPERPTFACPNGGHHTPPPQGAPR